MMGSVGFRVGLPGINVAFTAFSLCDFGQVISSLLTSIFLTFTVRMFPKTDLKDGCEV